MGYRRIKIDAADTTFSKYIRLRDKWCQRCLKPGTPDKYGNEIVGLDNSHFWSRGRESTRYDTQNCKALCRYCHEFFGGNPGEYTEFMINRLGQPEYDRLMIRANMTQQKDRKKSLLEAKELLKTLKGGGDA